jgi:hypothetical protein
MCEHMLLLDKVKRPEEIHSLWNIATEHNYHNLSLVFTNENAQVQCLTTPLNTTR